jgi:hypothetical protein
MTASELTGRDRDNSIPVSVENAAESLSAARRRLTILIVDEYDGSLDAGRLAEAIAAVETEQRMAELTSQDRKRVYISLYQHHLETLDDAGAIVYEDRSKKVHPTDATTGLAQIVRHLHRVCEQSTTPP